MKWATLATLAICATLMTLAVAPDDASAQVPPAQECYPISGGLDYHQFFCYDVKDPFCPVYTVTYTDAGSRKRCII